MFWKICLIHPYLGTRMPLFHQRSTKSSPTVNVKRQETQMSPSPACLLGDGVHPSRLSELPRRPSQKLPGSDSKPLHLLRNHMKLNF